MRLFVALTLFSVLRTSTTWAQPVDRAAEARKHFESGIRLYAKGQMVEALSEFEHANALKPDPALLYDLAQTHRSLGHDATALTYYRAFLDAAPYTPNREEVSGKIEIIKEELARREADQRNLESSVAAAAARSKEAEEAKRVAQELSATASLQKQQAQEAQRAANDAQVRANLFLAEHKPVPVYRRWWLWTIVGGLVAAGVVTTAMLATPKVPTTNQGSFAF